MSDARPADRRRRLPQRRQVDARQPARGRTGGGRPPRGRGDARPQGARLRVERRSLSPCRHRRRGPRRGRLAGRARCSARRARRSPTPTRSRSWSTPAPACARATPRWPRSCARGDVRWSSSPTRSTSPATPTWRPSSTGLGLGEPMPVSATHGHGTGDLLDRLAELARRAGRGAGEPRRAERRSRVARHRAAQRRQVLARQRVPRRRAGDRLRAGGDDPRRDRHRARVRRPRGSCWSTPPACDAAPRSPARVAYYAQLRSERAAERADVALVVCDASEGVTSEDLRVAELAMRSGCATLVALNKWDVGRDRPRGRHARGSRKRLRLRPPVITCSALTGRNVAEAARALDRARRPPRVADPDARAEPLRRRRRGRAGRRPRSAAGACASTTRRRWSAAARGSRSRSTTAA